MLASRDADFTLTDSELSISGVGSVSLQSVESASLSGGESANRFTFTHWTGSATAAGRAGDDRYVFNAAPSPAAYTIVELPAGGDDVVDFIAHGQYSPAGALDWMNPGGTVTAASLAWHPDVGSVSVGAEGQQLNIEYGLNVEASVDPVRGDSQGVRFEPVPYSVRFVDVGTKTTHTAVVDWGDGQKDDPATVIEDSTAVEGFVRGVHAFTQFGNYPIDVTVTDHSPLELWPAGLLPWDTSVTVCARVEILPAVVKDDPQRPGEQALFVGGSSDRDRVYVKQYPSGNVRVTMNNPAYSRLFRAGIDGPTPDGHIYTFTSEGDDWIKFYRRVDHDGEIYAGPDNDVLFGASGDDTLDGHLGMDHLFGMDGNDRLAGGAGTDFLYGFSGDDTLRGGDAPDFYYRNLVGDTFAVSDDRDYLYGMSGNDVLFGDAGDDFLFGDTGSDEIYGGAGADYLFGSLGHDVLVGGAGNDYLYGCLGDDLLDGGDGDDHLYGSLGRDVLVGAAGQDWLFGGPDRDMLIGGASADHLFADGGDDVLIGGATTHDADYAALRAIMAEWTAFSLIDTRIANLKNGTGLNGPVVLTPGGTVTDDGVRDELFGEADDDWFLTFDPDGLYFPWSNDRLN